MVVEWIGITPDFLKFFTSMDSFFGGLREVQRLNARIRVHREQLQGVEMGLKDIRKGKSGMVRIGSDWASSHISFLGIVSL